MQDDFQSVSPGGIMTVCTKKDEIPAPNVKKNVCETLNEDATGRKRVNIPQSGNFVFIGLKSKRTRSEAFLRDTKKQGSSCLLHQRTKSIRLDSIRNGETRGEKSYCDGKVLNRLDVVVADRSHWHPLENSSAVRRLCCDAAAPDAFVLKILNPSSVSPGGDWAGQWQSAWNFRKVIDWNFVCCCHRRWSFDFKVQKSIPKSFHRQHPQNSPSVCHIRAFHSLTLHSDQVEWNGNKKCDCFLSLMYLTLLLLLESIASREKKEKSEDFHRKKKKSWTRKLAMLIDSFLHTQSTVFHRSGWACCCLPSIYTLGFSRSNGTRLFLCYNLLHSDFDDDREHILAHFHTRNADWYSFTCFFFDRFAFVGLSNQCRMGDSQSWSPDTL